MKLTRLTLLLPVLLIYSASIHAQEEWKKIAPLGESFTALMPTAATSASRMIQLGEKYPLPGRVYYSINGGRRYMIVSFVRTTPDRAVSLSNFTDFARAIELSFAREDRSLTFDADLSDESGIVRQYRVQLGNYQGVARLLGNDKSLYAQIVIGADKTDPDAQRFLRSFQVGPVNTGPETNVDTISAPGTMDPPEPWPNQVAPISGGVLNGKALSLARPEYPKAARKNHDEGQVRVRIVIDEFGKVISAEAIEGPETLRPAAVDAALHSLFTPTRLMGQPVKVAGVIIYNFVAR